MSFALQARDTNGFHISMKVFFFRVILFEWLVQSRSERKSFPPLSYFDLSSTELLEDKIFSCCWILKERNVLKR